MNIFATLSITLTVLSFSHSSLANDCMGFPIETKFKTVKKGKCLGVVTTKEKMGWRAPRKIMALENGVFAVTDFGGWGRKNAGKLWILNIHTQEKYTLYSGGNMTHGLGIDSKGRLLISDGDRVLRAKTPGYANGTQFEVIISNLPLPTQKGSHPFKHFIVLKGDDLIVNIGSSSNDCNISARNKSCTARDSDPQSAKEGEAELRRYFYDAGTDSYEPRWLHSKTTKNYQVVAKGLRNSMALLQSPYDPNTLFQAENNMDTKNTPEEFNVVPLNSENFSEPTDFGWPFCSNDQVHVPFRNILRNFSNFCKTRATHPLFAIPNHASPLDMTMHQGYAHVDLNGKILMTWHGYRSPERFGLVAYSFDSDGLPLQNFEPLIESKSSHGKKTNLKPVGVTVDQNGIVFFVDDGSGKMYIYGNGEGSLTPPPAEELTSALVDTLNEEVLNRFSQLEQQLAPKCSQCHSDVFIDGDSNQTLRNMLDMDWINPEVQASDSKVFKRMRGAADVRASMPMGAAPLAESHPDLYQQLLEWTDLNL